MATLYFINGGFTDQWNDVNNWSLSSGGASASVRPTSSDDVIVDSNSPATIRVGATLGFTTPVCRNLTVDTGFAVNFIFTQFYALRIYGTLNLLGTIGNEITLAYNYTYPTYRNFLLFGTCGTVTHVNATKINSFGGKRIIFNASTCTIDTCPFWIDHTPTTRHITNATELQAINDNPHDDYILDNDIDMTGVNTWVPIGSKTLGIDIGSSALYVLQDSFTGTFNGQGHTISNLTYSAPSNRGYSYAALFGAVGSGLNPDGAFIRPTIENLTVRNCNFTGNNSCAGMVGFLISAEMLNCHVINATIFSNSTNAFSMGGFGGDCYGWTNMQTIINNCDVDTLNLTSNSSVGGFLGDSFCQSASSNFSIFQCYVNNAHITGVDDNGGDVGGFIGDCEGTVVKCYVNNVVMDCKGAGNWGGGFGLLEASITNFYCNGSIVNANYESGGFAGYVDDSTILNCYADVNVSGDGLSDNDLGGFIGRLESFMSPTVTNCYSTGIVSGQTNIGGFIGLMSTGTTLTNCSWFTGSNANAIGSYQGGSSKATLAEISAGTDEPDNTQFYKTDHPVYA